MKPLTIFVNASATAIVVNAKMKPLEDSDMTISAAIIETEEIALVNAMRGVCSSLDTCLINSIPRNVARTKIRRLITKSC